MKKSMLIILDGWGIGDKSISDVISNTSTPYLDSLYDKYAHSQLETSGENVGLPEGQMGNSEVGHLNIGAGKVVYQDLVRINIAAKDGTLKSNPVLNDAFEYALKNDKALHLIGLVSDGGVHSSQEHLHSICRMADQYGLKNVFVHAITDGRDTDPKSGLGFITDLEKNSKGTKVKTASLIGRYYAMDRDKRWERVKKAYDLYLKGKGNKNHSVIEAVQASYAEGITDEFIEPVIIVDENELPVGKIKSGDVVFCFNFRTDRLRELTTVLTQKDMPEEDMKTLDLYYLTMTRYDEKFKNVNIVFDKDNLKNTMGEILSKAGKKQLRIAETEKFAHVTFFFSGGREEVFEGESRILVPSPKVATYDLQPEMSALQVTENLVAEIEKDVHDFICLNFANGDMVGHTGIYPAIEKAVQTVDSCLEKVVEAAKKNYTIMITADHGNADYAVNPDGSPNTAHSTNPVPCILIDKDIKSIKKGILADIAPTLLSIMDLDIPAEMTGKVLV